MKLSERMINSLLRTFFRLFFRIDRSELAKVPQAGPLLMMVNHTSNLEGPMLYAFLQPRPLHALAKQELWEQKFMAYLMNMWKSIPVDRQNMGRSTMDACFKVLEDRHILAIAPEGTRSKDGNLQEGKGGVAFIAHKKDVPMIPVAVMGFPSFSKNIKRLRRTVITIKVGEVFEIVQKGGRIDADTRQALADEIMMRLAIMMPNEMRGHYKDKDIVFTLTRTLKA
ncbi:MULTISPECIES: lysophospholipid acyltransferase family protein [Sphaerochaeta]|jgi:1-acyl-sn-glycerol-3-phosphate acyltransferase|uniref:1-acyl-sn-glycerol-3-phosphate acyltransferase n=1 Tax=Sphaerochaeta associata TaxID=1129264 RepID=A0ABY4D6J6_9SPIR|nr:MULTISPECIES: lysophospholipid acyltransferase family protein [Sphaerochaeta]NLA96788.1 1-acyl-sn-glycerol-3-phosphate acyltransferase [Spirochaetales bacterium]MDD2395088.1 lysophospholipid acyltransferase family protein [Sphaerochaeta sp.]MDD3424516.1 lysophospholipid acyltransferase family protein [Sphaerochaeta sp.]MDD3455449.1 lysophospholipid acyltransferase family protein [Sphaerochaeta sp.]MDD4037540.1 lysophospholipid acyltransferase family protein [Sphaerochaeta sp.]